MHSYPSRGAGELRGLIEHWFEEFRLSRPVVRNLPPAFMLSGQFPRHTRNGRVLATAAVG